MSEMPSETQGAQPPPQKKSFAKTFFMVVLVLVGAGAVLFIGIWLGGLLLGSKEADVDLPDPAPNAPYAVSNDYVNVRSGPSTDYPIYGIAKPGDKAEVIGKSPDGRWWTVKLPTNMVADGKGWVSADYVTATNADGVPVIEPPPLPPDVSVPPPGAGKASCTTNEPINIRSGPGNAYPSYGKVPIGVKGEVVGVSQDGGWWVVLVPTTIAESGEGWVNANYCVGENTSGVPVKPAP